MANRRDKLNQSNPLGIKRIPSQHEMLSDMARDDGPEPIELVNIFDILPDPQQPRRSVPPSILADWDGDTISVKSHLLDPWLNAFGHEVGLEYNEVKSLIQTVVSGKELARDENHNPGPFETSLFKIVNLAASIRDKGLINPITIFEIKEIELYRIETGERRWLAYHLLSNLEETGWFKIPARIIESPNIWKQAYENNSRDDLNAIGKSRQYALLLMDLLKAAGRTFNSIDNFGDDQLFYAQVKDDRIPDKKGQVLLNGMGMSSRGALAEYRSFLKLPLLVWQYGDEYNWSRERLYELSKLPPEDAVDRAHILRKMDEREKQDVLSQNILPAGRTPKQPREDYFELDTKAFRADATRIARVLASGKPMSSKKREALLDDIEKLRQWLNDAEQIVHQRGS